jgi:hypothetical protein
LVSTLLSLVFVPAMFVIIDKLENLVAKLLGRKSHAAAHPQAQAAE